MTDTMLASFFSSEVDEKNDGEATVVFSGTYAVLGDYTVDIRDGRADASWSFEGRDTSGMFDAEAWGLEQLQEMLRVTTTDHDVTAFFHKAEEVEKEDQSGKRPGRCQAQSEACRQGGGDGCGCPGREKRRGPDSAGQGCRRRSLPDDTRTAGKAGEPL